MASFDFLRDPTARVIPPRRTVSELGRRYRADNPDVLPGANDYATGKYIQALYPDSFPDIEDDQSPQGELAQDVQGQEIGRLAKGSPLGNIPSSMGRVP